MAAALWRRRPRISRDLLVLAIGYRIQDIEQGGLGEATRRKLLTIAKTLRTSGRVAATPSLSLKPGARLWRAAVLARSALSNPPEPALPRGDAS